MSKQEEECVQEEQVNMLQSEIRFSDSLKSIAPAIVAAQGRMKNPPKSSTNPHFHSKFAGLDVTMEAAIAAFGKEGIAVLTPAVVAPDGYVGVAVLLLHKSGEFIESHGLIPLDRPGPQAAGSAMTYARRYLVQAALGLVGETDDDAESATNHKNDDAPAPRKSGKSIFSR